MKARTQLLMAATGVGVAAYVATLALTAATVSPLTIVGVGLIALGLYKSAREEQQQAAPAATDRHR